MRLAGKLGNWIKETFSDSKPRSNLQEQCARYYVTCLLMACSVPPASLPADISEASIKRAFTLVSALNQEFDGFVDKLNPTNNQKQWKNEVV